MAANPQDTRLVQLGAKVIGDIDFSRYALPESEAAKVRLADEWAGDVTDHFAFGSSPVGAVLPWGKTHGAIKLRKGELSVWAGVNGHGKSLLHSQVSLGLVRQGLRVCIASLEMKPVQTMVRMARQGVGSDQPSPSLVDEFVDCLRGNLWLYDQQGTVDSRKMLAVVRYCREELNIEHFVIDSLMKCGMGADDYNAQKHFVDALSTYAKDTDVHIHLIAHSRKRQNEHGIMDKFDVKGASEITDMADNVFTVWRNKPKEEAAQKDVAGKDKDDHPDAILVCDKQRNGDWEGRVNLWFHKRAQQYLARPTTQAIDMMRWHPGYEL